MNDGDSNENEQKTLDAICTALTAGTRCALVRGAAGTGKTTLVRALLPRLEERGWHAVLLAPTGRAAKVLEQRTRRAARTVHAAIYEAPSEPTWDAEQGLWRWHFGLQKAIPSNVVVIVDEASMVGRAPHTDENLVFGTGSLLQDLIRWSGVHLPECRNRIVFVGDAFQLPPVGESADTPPALDPAVLAELVGQPPFEVELADVHRQARQSGILCEAMRLRAALVLRNFGRLCFQPHDDVALVDESRFLEAYRAVPDLDRKMVLAHTNEHVWNYNGLIRAALGRTAPEPVPGDRLLSLRNTAVGDLDDRLEFRNGDLLEVTAVGRRNLVLDGFYRAPGAATPLHYTFTFRELSVRWTSEPECGEETCWMNLSPITSETWRTHERFASAALFGAVRNEIRARHKAAFAALDAHARALRERELLRQSVLLRAPIVTYGYAMTVHKAQGGDWDAVWIDGRFVGRPDTEAYFRWAYTAVTRAKRRLALIAAPRVDALVAALSRGIARREQEDTPAEAPAAEGPAGRSLAAALGAGGYVVRRCEERDWARRCRIARADMEVPCGWIDVHYNGKGRVSGVSLHVEGLPAAVCADLLALRGLPVRQVMGEAAAAADDAAVAVRDVALPHRSVAARLCAAARKGRMTVRALVSKGAFLLRMEVATARGEGFVECYFNGKGAVSAMGNTTLAGEDLRVLCEMLKEEEQDDA